MEEVEMQEVNFHILGLREQPKVEARKVASTRVSDLVQGFEYNIGRLSNGGIQILKHCG
jgi:hypothetical protein